MSAPPCGFSNGWKSYCLLFEVRSLKRMGAANGTFRGFFDIAEGIFATLWTVGNLALRSSTQVRKNIIPSHRTVCFIVLKRPLLFSPVNLPQIIYTSVLRAIRVIGDDIGDDYGKNNYNNGNTKNKKFDFQ